MNVKPEAVAREGRSPTAINAVRFGSKIVKGFHYHYTVCFSCVPEGEFARDQFPQPPPITIEAGRLGKMNV